MPSLAHTQNRQSSSASTVNLRGVLLPFTTPFKVNEELDLGGLRKNLHHWNQTGISGYVVLGSTGERVHLDEREYLAVVECARAEVPANLTFIAGVGQQSTRMTTDEIKKVAALGVDAVLAITPSFYRSAITQAALVSHYTAIADQSPVPVILYSMPDLTGIVIEPETAATLSTHPNIVGMKDSAGDLVRFTATLSLAEEQFAVITGNGTMLFDAFRAGARGAILAVGCVAWHCCLQIVEAMARGDLESARSLQEQLTPLALAVTKRYGIGGLKAAMDSINLVGGAVRSPLIRPGVEARQEITDLLRAVVGEGRQDPAGRAGVVTT